MTIIERTAPLTFSQESLWFFYQMDPGSRIYNLGLFFKLTGILDFQAFEKSLNRVVARHEPLRTTILVEGDAAQQAIHAFEPFALKQTEMPGTPEAERLPRAEARPTSRSLKPCVRARSAGDSWSASKVEPPT